MAVDSLHHALIRPDDSEIRLEPRLIRLLTRLAAAHGEPVARELLLAEVSNLPYTGDEALTQAISKLRHALGDTAKSPQFIKTIPKRGYALIAPVGELDVDVPENGPTFNQVGELENRDQVVTYEPSRNQSILMILALAILVLSGLLVWIVLGKSGETVRETEIILDQGEQEFIEKKE